MPLGTWPKSVFLLQFPASTSASGLSLNLAITEGLFLELGSRVKVGNVITSVLPNSENVCKANISTDHMENGTFPLIEL